MIQALRRKLTLLFLCSFLLIYGLGGAAALAVFYSGLSAALDEEISDLSSEILPAIKLSTEAPTLKDWADEAKKEHLKYPAGIQIFDKSKNLLESYGLSRKVLQKGEFELGDQDKTTIRSSFEKLIFDGKLHGFLQVQISTRARDHAVREFGDAIVFILPFLSVVVAFAGYFFSGLAIKPVERSIDVLKTFVADAGHEFTTPITVVEASLQTLEEILKEHDGVGLEIVSIIGRASNSMKELSNDLIYLARIENPDMQLRKETVSVHEFIEPSIESLLELARSKNVDLSSSQIPDFSVNGNLHALKTMVSNLLTNAIKYTDEGGKVIVKVSQEGSKVCIAVEDSGIGIPAQNLDQIFERFYRVDKSRARSAGGSGLGLAIVKAILELHQGDIDVQSTPGKGSTFTVRLQRAS